MSVRRIQCDGLLEHQDILELVWEYPVRGLCGCLLEACLCSGFVTGQRLDIACIVVQHRPVFITEPECGQCLFISTTLEVVAGDGQVILMEIPRERLHRREGTLHIADLDLLYAGIDAGGLHRHASSRIDRCITGSRCLHERRELQPRNIVKRIHLQVLRDAGERLFDPAELPEDIGPKATCLHVMRILHERLLGEFERTLEVSAACLNRRQIVEAALLLRTGPCCLKERIEGLIFTSLIQEIETKLIIWLRIIRIRVLPGRTLDGGTEVRLCFLKLTAPQQQCTVGRVEANVSGVTL